MENYPKASGQKDPDPIADENIPIRAKKILEDSGFNIINPDIDLMPRGINDFPGAEHVFWTDASIDASTKVGRESIAKDLGVNLEDLVSFSAANHTNEVLIIDNGDGLRRIEKAKNPLKEEALDAGWSEPIITSSENPSHGAERGTYDGIILVGKENFDGKYLLATGADCTPVGIRGLLKSGEEFIAIAHGGRKGTMTGIMENMAKRLQWLGAVTESLQIFVGPSAQAIEVPVEVLEKEAGDDNSWRASSVSDDYEKDGSARVLYNNQLDTTRRIYEQLGVSEDQVHVINADTVTDKSEGKLHSFRREKTSARNSLIVGF